MRISFVCPSAYPTLVPGEFSFAGGAEYQQVLLGRALVERGHEVAFVVGDYGQDRTVEVDGMLLHRSFRLFEGHRKLRFIPDMLRLRSALRRSAPELVYQRSTAFYTGQSCLFSHELGAAFAFALGSDYNAHPDLMGRAPRLVQSWYRWGVEHAELVIAQTASQASLMAQNFACQPVVLANMLPLPPTGEGPEGGEYVLWVGSMAKLKRPELFIELARAMPNQRFRMVGGGGEDRGYDEYVRKLAQGVSNLELSGFIPQEAMHEVYQGATVLVNTSTFEGLPNTYLHAWSWGVPVLTVNIDPDGVIAGKGLGSVAGRPEDLPATLEQLLEQGAAGIAMAARCRAHVHENHDVGILADRAAGLFEEVVPR